jgi:hypothetical protein
MKFFEILKKPFTNVILVIISVLICLLSTGNNHVGSHNFEGLFAILVFMFLGFAILCLYLLLYIMTKNNYWFVCWIGVLIMIFVALFLF